MDARVESSERLDTDLLRAIAESAVEGIVVIDEGGAIELINPAAERLFGYQASEVLGKNVSILMPEPARSNHEQYVRRYLDGGPRRVVGVGREVKGRRKDGTLFPMRLSVSEVVRDDRTFFAGMMHDLTEDRRLDARLRLAAAVFDHACEGIMVTDRRGNIVAANSAFTRATGYSEREVLGRNPRLFKSGRHGPSFYASMWRSIRGTGTWQGEVWNRRKNGEIYSQWASISAVKDRDGQSENYVALFTDLGAIKQTEERLAYLAHHDPLTNLPNRLLFDARLQHAIEAQRRYGGYVGVLFLDLDEFKAINDGLGHTVGDELLKAVARRLSETVRRADSVARLGGDEFVILLDRLGDEADARDVARKLRDAIRRPFQVADHKICVSMSLGISVFPRHGRNAQAIVEYADAAMYRAKRQRSHH